jgi:hypothetical protein
MILLFSAWAERVYRWRWHCGAITIATWLLLFVCIFVPGVARLVPLLTAISIGPLFVCPWGVLCMCVWFHPTQGKLMTGSLISRLPRLVIVPIRLWFAAFLTFWFALGICITPIMLITGRSSWV